VLLPGVMGCVEREVAAAGGVATGLERPSRGVGGEGGDGGEGDGRGGWLQSQGDSGA